MLELIVIYSKLWGLGSICERLWLVVFLCSALGSLFVHPLFTIRSLFVHYLLILLTFCSLLFACCSLSFSLLPHDLHTTVHFLLTLVHALFSLFFMMFHLLLTFCPRFVHCCSLFVYLCAWFALSRGSVAHVCAFLLGGRHACSMVVVVSLSSVGSVPPTWSRAEHCLSGRGPPLARPRLGMQPCRGRLRKHHQVSQSQNMFGSSLKLVEANPEYNSPSPPRCNMAACLEAESKEGHSLTSNARPCWGARMYHIYRVLLMPGNLTSTHCSTFWFWVFGNPELRDRPPSRQPCGNDFGPGPKVETPRRQVVSPD